MRRIRVIPVLLIQNGGLVKSRQFKNYRYVGDPINAVRIFNDKEVDELVLLDISATAEFRTPNIAGIREIASEAFMPLGYGGGITKLDEIKQLINSGVEKVILNSIALNDYKLVENAARYVGSQSVVISIDVRKNFWGKYSVFKLNGRKNTYLKPDVFAKQMEEAGAGEILLNAIDRDGTYKGYDEELIQRVSSSIKIPMVAVGGAATVLDFAKAVKAGASAVAAGSMFVFQQPHQAVLISYPSQKELAEKLFRNA